MAQAIVLVEYRGQNPHQGPGVGGKDTSGRRFFWKAEIITFKNGEAVRELREEKHRVRENDWKYLETRVCIRNYWEIHLRKQREKDGGLNTIIYFAYSQIPQKWQEQGFCFKKWIMKRENGKGDKIAKFENMIYQTLKRCMLNWQWGKPRSNTTVCAEPQGPRISGHYTPQDVAIKMGLRRICWKPNTALDDLPWGSSSLTLTED